MSHDQDAGRIGPLAALPVFFRLQGRRVLVAGDGQGLAWKVDVLLAAGARVWLVTKGVDPAVPATACADAGLLAHLAGDWCASDFAGVALAVGNFEDETSARAFSAAARSHGVPVCLVDRPLLSDVCFGAIVSRGPLTIAISTGGAAPVVAQAIRRRIEALLPSRLGAWLSAAQALRAEPSFAGRERHVRRRFWERFAERLFDRGEHEPDESDLVAGIDVDGPALGSLVTMDDAGGSPDDLTLRAVRALQCADIIVHDRSVPTDVLRLARREAERVSVDGFAPRADASGVARCVLAELAAGRRVVRLWSAATPSALREAELSCFEKLDIAMACLQVSGHGATSGRPAVAARNRAAGGNLRVGRVSGRRGRKRVVGQRRLTTGERDR